MGDTGGGSYYTETRQYNLLQQGARRDRHLFELREKVSVPSCRSYLAPAAGSGTRVATIKRGEMPSQCLKVT